jgi:hypothetical protein
MCLHTSFTLYNFHIWLYVSLCLLQLEALSFHSQDEAEQVHIFNWQDAHHTAHRTFSIKHGYSAKSSSAFQVIRYLDKVCNNGVEVIAIMI